MPPEGVRATLLEPGQHRTFIFDLGLCLFSCNITGTLSKSNGSIVSVGSTLTPIYFNIQIETASEAKLCNLTC